MERKIYIVVDIEGDSKKWDSVMSVARKESSYYSISRGNILNAYDGCHAPKSYYEENPSMYKVISYNDWIDSGKPKLLSEYESKGLGDALFDVKRI